MKLKECLEKISKEDYKRLLSYYGLKNAENLRKNNDGCLNNVILSYVRYLDDLDIESLNNINNGKVNVKNSKKLIEKGLAFKIDNKVVICDEVKEILEEFNGEDGRLCNKALKLMFYLFAYGAIEENKFLTLAKKISNSKDAKKLVEGVKESDMTCYENGIVFINEYAKDKYQNNKKFQKAVNASLKNYRTFSSDEIAEIDNFYKHVIIPCIVGLFINSDSSDKEYVKAIGFAEDFISCIMVGNIENKVDKLLKEHQLTLNKKSKNELEGFIFPCAYLLPSWLQNGKIASDNDDITDARSMYRSIGAISVGADSFDDKCFLDDLDGNKFDGNILEDENVFIKTYVTINGVLKIDTLIDLLKKSNIDMNKNEVVQYIEESEDLFLDDDCVSVIGEMNFMTQALLNKKEKFGNYKIIDDPEELVYNLNDKLLSIDLLLDEYKIDEETSNYLKLSILMNGNVSDCFEKTCEVANFVMSEGVKKRFLNELVSLTESLPIWMYNGYSEKEFKKLNRKSQK